MSFLMRLKQEDMHAGKEGRLVCFVQYLQDALVLKSFALNFRPQKKERVSQTFMIY